MTLQTIKQQFQYESDFYNICKYSPYQKFSGTQA